MRDSDLQHPDITAAERTGYPRSFRFRPRKYTDCDWCGKSIIEGDEYYDVHGEILCMDCMSECRRYAMEEF